MKVTHGSIDDEVNFAVNLDLEILGKQLDFELTGQLPELTKHVVPVVSSGISGLGLFNDF